MSDLLLFSTCRVTSFGVGQEPGAFLFILNFVSRIYDLIEIIEIIEIIENI